MLNLDPIETKLTRTTIEHVGGAVGYRWQTLSKVEKGADGKALVIENGSGPEEAADEITRLIQTRIDAYPAEMKAREDEAKQKPPKGKKTAGA